MSEAQAQYVAVGSPVECEENRIAMLLGRAKLACDALEPLIPVARLPWTVGFADKQGYDMLDRDAASVATLRDPSRERNGYATRYAHEALIQVPHLVPALRHLLGVTTAQRRADDRQTEMAELGQLALALALAQQALAAHDAASDALGSTRDRFPDERDNNRFWLGRGEARGYLCRAVADAQADLDSYAATWASPEDCARRLTEAETHARAARGDRYIGVPEE
jgi:hypothetical protein